MSSLTAPLSLAALRLRNARGTRRPSAPSSLRSVPRNTNRSRGLTVRAAAPDPDVSQETTLVCQQVCNSGPLLRETRRLEWPLIGPVSQTGVVFSPMAEIVSQPVSPTLDDSLARQRYSAECEAAINDQIKRATAKLFLTASTVRSADTSALPWYRSVEYNVSYIYHAMYAYFDRDNVALPGLAKFFKESSDEEREHAEKLMNYQNLRGGRVKLQSMISPESEFANEEKGDALYAMELALSLEKLNNEKLLALHKVADEAGDVQMCDFVESELLGEQVEAIRKISTYVAQLRRVGKGHGVWHWDKELEE
eukprot:scaffold7946_cov403-Prasinococcus_capsulatus_cf.AAC.9